MAVDKFSILLPGVVLVSVAFIVLGIMNSITSGDDFATENLGVVSITNVTSAETYNGQISSLGGLQNATPTLIRDTPGFTCNSFFMYDNATGTSANANMIRLRCNSSVTAGSTEVFYWNGKGASFNSTPAFNQLATGTVMLILAGNSSNASAAHAAAIKRPFNISYSALKYDASYNVTQNIESGSSTFSKNSGTIYLLLLIAIVLAVALSYVGFGNVGGGSGGEGGGKINIGNPFSHFKRD